MTAMNECWGTDWLPPSVARRAARDDAREQREAHAADAERERRVEDAHQRHLALAAEQAGLRGDVVTALQLATGQVRGRSVAEILDAGRLAGDRDDVIAAARLHRDGHGTPEPLHVEVGEPVLHQARSETGWKIANRARHFRDLLDARKALAAAERAAEQSRLDYGLVDGVTLQPRAGRRP
jgi:hypothetical protein